MKVKKEYVKSPLNYVGGKYKLLQQMLPKFPNEINTFVDLFGGGFNVGVNVPAKRIVYNDKSKQVTELLQYQYDTEIQQQLQEIDAIIAEYQLSKENADGYNQLRDDYNKAPTPIKFYVLICYAFNNQYRFNNKGQFNMPFGKNRSSFNETLRKRYIAFVEEMKKHTCIYGAQDFREMQVPNDKTFIYCDPPYLATQAVYNSCEGGWTEKDEKDLLQLLKNLSTYQIPWALSNNIMTNPALEQWAIEHNYNINRLEVSYSNCNYHKKDKQTPDAEVLICNYKAVADGRIEIIT